MLTPAIEHLRMLLLEFSGKDDFHKALLTELGVIDGLLATTSDPKTTEGFETMREMGVATLTGPLPQSCPFCGTPWDT